MTFIGSLLKGALARLPQDDYVNERQDDRHMLNVWTVRNGGIRFVRVGRLFFSFGISRDVRPLGSK